MNNNIAYYNNVAYSFGKEDQEVYNLCSLELNKDFTPIKIVKGVKKQDIKGAYKSKTWVKVKGCTTLYERKKGDLITLGVRPSEDIDVLGAKEVDRGVWEVVVDRREIESVWEEREPYLDFPFPEDIDRVVPLNVEDL
jgi:hypothetical protein